MNVKSVTDSINSLAERAIEINKILTDARSKVEDEDGESIERTYDCCSGDCVTKLIDNYTHGELEGVDPDPSKSEMTVSTYFYEGDIGEE